MAATVTALRPEKTYDDLVAEGREASKLQDQANWTRGDLALKVESLSKSEAGAMSKSDGAPAPLQQYAKDIDVEYGSLKTWRSTSEAWPLTRRRARRSWSTHRVLNAQPDRFDLIDQVKTRADAQKIVRERDKPKGSPDVLPSTFGDRLVYALGELSGRTDAIENLLRANDGRKFRDRHIEMCQRTAAVLKAQHELMDRIGSGEFEAIEAQQFIEILNAPWRNELK
jgi:hypothetical protein